MKNLFILFIFMPTGKLAWPGARGAGLAPGMTPKA